MKQVETDEAANSTTDKILTEDKSSRKYFL